MKKILISIRPQWVVKILNGEKTIEIRKTAPKCELPCEVYIYCTNGREVLKPNKINPQYRKIKAYSIKKGCVCAKFTLNKVLQIKKYKQNGLGYWAFGNEEIAKRSLSPCELSEHSCVSQEDLEKYLNGKKGYAWKISDLVIFDKPKELGDFIDSGTPTYEQTKSLVELSGKPYSKETYREHCERLGYTLKRPPQSWQYVNEI